MTVFASTLDRRNRPRLSDRPMLFAAVALGCCVCLHGWFPKFLPASLGSVAAFLFLASRVTREFGFARWTDAALRDCERQLRLLAYCTTDAIVEFGPGFRARYVSPRSEGVLGCAPHRLLGRDSADFVHPEAATVMSDYLAGVASGANHAPSICRGRARDDGETWLAVTGYKLDGSDGVAVSLRDVTRQRDAEMLLERASNQLQRLVMLDDMTGLANRRCFDLVLGQELRRAARSAKPLAVLLIEVDRLEAFREIYGLAARDACLRAVAVTLARRIGRATDLVARFGLEFAVLLAETDGAGAVDLAEHVREAIHLLGIVHCGNPDRRLTVSIGIAAAWPDQGLGNAESSVARAQAALCEAAAAGGDRVWAATLEPTESADA